ncbi:hypothetical protein F4604DRAFT_1734037 [Suillus subluteus]|nr:hypothetical protein F4604DRAFT_1734037 [Suillus subluteus]
MKSTSKPVKNELMSALSENQLLLMCRILQERTRMPLPLPLYTLCYHFSMTERSLRTGTWKTPWNAAQTHDVTGRRLGILGLGGIGLQFAHLAHAFPMCIIYFSRRRQNTMESRSTVLI